MLKRGNGVEESTSSAASQDGAKREMQRSIYNHKTSGRIDIATVRVMRRAVAIGRWRGFGKPLVSSD